MHSIRLLAISSVLGELGSEDLARFSKELLEGGDSQPAQGLLANVLSAARKLSLQERSSLLEIVLSALEARTENELR
ncbi:MAG: hypothetical protein NVS9B12_13080 [Vulcanimicrobiaceae bacterium]